ncbi:MAG: sigma-70 family RNA polymerase sigma factor [Austwickia sp.]|jgi:RNA polymerase sigma factor (sigma-70 family)|nr:sigma-70 family RNA polymerase sigma factor [Austwickia sp.]MBK8436251.1 sigma-70 family RNA polymerase sigma factor [Austwickia sp.]MBK9101928.1 sigma-70 family RNA polymerase sigma factor [Austwickia sp.]
MLTSQADVRDLVAAALGGDQGAWRDIVDRYSPIVWAACRAFRLADPDAADVAQTVFLRLVEHLPAIHEPAALPGWIRTTARRECLRAIEDRNRQALSRFDDLATTQLPPDPRSVDEALLAGERNAALRDAFATLSTECQDLLALLMRDKPLPYKQISAMLDRPIGSIGPTRLRCLNALRSAPVLAPWAPTAACAEGHTP